MKMGWTCQYDHNGYCKRLKTQCIPGLKGCILQTHDGIVFSSPPASKKQEEPVKRRSQEEIDFAALARSN